MSACIRYSGCGPTGYPAARWLYFTFFSVSGALAWTFRASGERISSAGTLSRCRAATGLEDDEVDKCFAKEAVLRMTFAVFLFFAGHLLLVSGTLAFERTRGQVARLAQAGVCLNADALCSNASASAAMHVILQCLLCCQAWLQIVCITRCNHPKCLDVGCCSAYGLHAGFWPAKALAWGALCLISFFGVHNGTLDSFFQFARVLAAVFVLLQLVVVLETVFRLNEKVIGRVDCMLPIIGVTVLLFLGFFVALVLLYVFFAPSGGCSRNIAFVTVTLLFAIAVTALSVSSMRIESAGLLTAALICVYGVWLCASALYSAPLDSCSKLSQSAVAPNQGTNWLTVRSRPRRAAALV
jgi:Serine incorporator (Serinc)